MRGERGHRMAAIREICAAVRATRGSVRGAAAILGVGWRTLKRWIAEYPDLSRAVWRITRLRWGHRPRGAKMRRPHQRRALTVSGTRLS